MEDVATEFYRRVSIYREGPPLYRCDPEVPNLISHELRDYAARGVPEQLLRLSIESFLTVHNDADARADMAREYALAFQNLREAVQSNPLLASYKVKPSKVTLDRLAAAFVEVAPRSAVLRAANLSEFNNRLFSIEFAPLDAMELQALEGTVRQLSAIGADVLDVQQSVRAVQDIINDCDNVVVAMVLRIGFTPEGFRFDIEDAPDYIHNTALTKLVFSMLRTHVPPNAGSSEYAIAWSMMMRFASRESPVYLNLLRCVWPPPDANTFSEVVPENMRDTIELAGEAFRGFVHGL